MSSGFEDRVALVTGGGQGIGRATAGMLIERGASVVVSDVDEARAAAAATELGPNACAAAGDVSDPAAVLRIVGKALEQWGRLDVLVTAAGILHPTRFGEIPLSEWRRTLDVNLTGVFLCCQASARQMVRQGGGRIIVTASINGFRGVENLVGYNVAKAGVIELTRTMAVELAQHHVTVNAIAPAQIDTRLTRGLPEEARRRRVERIPMGRFGEADEVARAALFLASDDASYVTGHTLAVDGGYLAGGLWSRR